MAPGDTVQGLRLPDAVLGVPGPGWDAWDHGGAMGGKRPPLGSYQKVLNTDGSTAYWNILDLSGRPGTIRQGGHSITEFEDGTITVSPSILATEEEHGHDWHGFLERGIWKEA